MGLVHTGRSGAVLLTTISIVVGLLAAIVSAPAQASPETGGVFVPITPTRLYDSSVSGSSQATPTSGRNFAAVGAAGIPTTGVGAVVVDVAAKSTTGHTNVYVKKGGSTAQASFLSVGDDTAWHSNTIVVAPSASGTITVETSARDIDFNVDVQGYFTSASADSSTGGFVPITPTRLVGTNTGIGLPQAKLNGGTVYNAQIAGQANIPADATAVFANVRILNASVSGSFKTGASGTSVGTGVTAINDNAADVYDDSGMSIKLGSGGKVGLYVSSGTADVILDVQGYFTAGTTGGGYTPLSNTRFFDSRDSTALTAGATREVPVAGLAGVPNDDTVGSVAMTVSAANWTGTGSVTIDNPDIGSDGTSNIAFKAPFAHDGDSSTSIVELSGDGTIEITNNSSGSVDILLSAQGWFAEDSEVQAPGEVAGVDDPEISTSGTEDDVPEVAPDLASAPDGLAGTSTPSTGVSIQSATFSPRSCEGESHNPHVSLKGDTRGYTKGNAQTHCLSDASLEIRVSIYRKRWWGWQKKGSMRGSPYSDDYKISRSAVWEGCDNGHRDWKTVAKHWEYEPSATYYAASSNKAKLQNCL